MLHLEVEEFYLFSIAIQHFPRISYQSCGVVDELARSIKLLYCRFQKRTEEGVVGRGFVCSCALLIRFTTLF